MKRSILVFILLVVIALSSDGQFYPGNPQWKWDTVVLYNTSNELSSRYTQTLDDGGNILQQFVEKRENNLWVNYLKTDIGYVDGRMETATSAAWVNGSWQNVSRITAGYDPLGRINSELIEQYKTNVWVNYRQRQYTYSLQNQKMQMVQERWGNGSWKNDLKTDYTYDTEGHLETVTSQFSETGEDWINGMKLLYTCDENGNYLEASVETWETDQWVAGHKIFYSNDARGNILTETYATLTGSAWMNEFRRIFTYDENNNNLTGKNELFINLAWIPEMSSSYLYYGKEYLLMLQEENYRFEASYRHFPLGIFELPDRTLNLYPNPVSEVFNLSDPYNVNRYNELSIYTLGGKLVRQVIHPEFENINVKDLENGLYIIKVTSDQGSGTGKIIISH